MGIIINELYKTDRSLVGGLKSIPMNDRMSNGTDDGFETRQKLHNQFMIIERYRDFMGWLFDTHLEYISETEAWEEFDKYQDELINKQQTQNND